MKFSFVHLFVGSDFCDAREQSIYFNTSVFEYMNDFFNDSYLCSDICTIEKVSPIKEKI